MSKTRRYILCGVAMLLTAGCTTDLPDLEQTAALVPIGVSVGDGAVTTRAGIEVQEAQFQSGETFYVRFADGSAVDPAGESLASTKFTTTDGNGTAAPTEGSVQPYFNPEVSSTTLYAYYPQTVTERTTSFEVLTDQTTDEAYKASDLMYATTTALKKGTSVTIPLKFEHRLAKITVLAMAVDNVSKIRGIRIISGFREVNLSDPATATPGTSLDKELSSSSPLQMYRNDGGEDVVFTAAVLPPQTVEGSFLEFDTNDGTYTYPIRRTTFEGGHAYTLALRVGAVQGSDEGGVSNTGGSGGRRLTISYIDDEEYTGDEITPNIEVKNENGEIVRNDDPDNPYYKVIYSNAIQVGCAQVIVVGLRDYMGCVATSHFNIVQAAGTVAFEKATDEVTYWDSPFNTYNGNTLIISGDYGSITYSTEDTDIVSVDADGVVTLYNPGTSPRTATITATVTDGRNYHYASPTASYTLTILPWTEIELGNEIDDWDDGDNTNGTVEF